MDEDVTLIRSISFVPKTVLTKTKYKKYLFLLLLFFKNI